MEPTPEQLIQRYLIGEADAAEVARLDALLAGDAELRKRFIAEAGTDAGLREIALERVAGGGSPAGNIVAPVFRSVAWVSAAAAVVMLGLLIWTQASQPRVIASIASAENAAWESSLPTEPGSDLTRGYLTLTSGIATIRFRSGAEITLEAPAKLVLETPMRGQLMSGAAVVDVPDSAIGFTLVTPDGYAIDYGTRFSVNVDEAAQRSDFEVLSGEISVHHPGSEQEVYLRDRQATSLTPAGLEKWDGPLPEEQLERPGAQIRIGTRGRSTSVIRNDERMEFLHEDFLMAKRSVNTAGHDRRALLSFDIAKVDWSAVAAARVRLNLVPCGLGFRAHLPKVNRFALYGISGTKAGEWQVGSAWDAAPTPADGVLLGRFEVPRSVMTGTFGIETAELFEFLKSHADGAVTLLLVRETTELEGRGLVHAFASDTHPEASGPLLELSPTDSAH